MKNEKKVIEIKKLCKKYKMFHRKKDRLVETIFPMVNKHTDFVAMDKLDLTVKQGEVLGILGKNGAGKSTLLKMITGVVVPTDGEIKVNGKISSLLELGTAFNMELTGEENIYQHGQVMGLSKEEIESKKEDIISFADIGEHLYQPVKTYSSGMFARLAFACAINVDPDILIVDEVLSVGDMAFQLKCFKKFEEIKKKGKTILFVTHNVGDVLRNCTRTIILENGKKTFDGDVKDGVELYKKMITGNDKNDEKFKALKKEKSSKENKDKNLWKSNFFENPNLIEYGNLDAEVFDYGVFDLNDKYKKLIYSQQDVVFKSKIRFHKDVDNPIFTMTIKNFNGIEIAGTNTMIEKIYTGKYKKGDVVEVKFIQKLPLAPNRYTLSFSCTYINASGNLEVLNRKYEALLIEVLSDKGCVGTVMLDTKIELEKNKT